jgi:hypothetical protein
VFALLVLATVGAFFATQRLKGDQPVVLRFSTRPPAFSPNGDDFRDFTRVGFDLSEPTRVTFEVVDADGDRVRRLVDDRRLAGDRRYRFRWDGRDERGRVVRDGGYRLRLTRPDQGRVLNSLKEVVVDTKPPDVLLTTTRPNVISTDETLTIRPVRIRYRGPENEFPEFRLFRTDPPGGGAPEVVARLRGDDTRSMVWNGLLHGRPAPPGNYAVSVRVRDPAGNPAQSPPGRTPTPADARAGTGILVRNLTLRGPLEPVRPGQTAPFELGPQRRRVRWDLRRAGARRPAATGRTDAARFRVRVPQGQRAGLFVLRVEAAGGLAATAPVAVTGSHPVLVVLPALSWQAANREDDDRDGFADTLGAARVVRLDRPFAGSGVPPALRAETLPLLRFLDRERLGYVVTTDLALARGRGPRIEGSAGVALAGSVRWLPAEVGRRLRRYVERGGALASFGADALRREAEPRGERLVAVGPARPRDVFGEATERFTTVPAPLRREQDDLGLFAGVDLLFGSFREFEISRGLARGARLVVAAGRDPGRPAFVAYRLGRGIVVRVGTPDWSGELDERRLDLAVPQVTERVWRTVLGG